MQSGGFWPIRTFYPSLTRKIRGNRLDFYLSDCAPDHNCSEAHLFHRQKGNYDLASEAKTASIFSASLDLS